MLTVFTISILTIFTVAVYQVNHEDNSARPAPCPPGPAWDPTALPASWRGSPPHGSLKQFNQEISSIMCIIANYSAGSPGIKDVNFIARYVNGNRRSNGIKMAHINLGSGYLVNNMNNIETIIGG